MTGRSDLELVEGFQRGEENAFNEIVLRYQEKIYWTVRRFVNDHDEADDVVQEVFVKAYGALKGFRAESGLHTWLYRIAVNRCLNYLRRLKVREFLRIERFEEEEDSGTDRPDEAVEKEEQRALIEAAVKRLPEKQKAVFVMRYYEEMPYEEIAKVLKTSVGGLKANFFHAVRKIEEYVKRAHGT